MEEIVIAGISGRLPESDNLQEFWENLFNGVDMVTEDDRRWKPGEARSWLLCLISSSLVSTLSMCITLLSVVLCVKSF